MFLGLVKRVKMSSTCWDRFLMYPSFSRLQTGYKGLFVLPTTVSLEGVFLNFRSSGVRVPWFAD